MLLTWLALTIGIGTGFNKMQDGTPFPRGLKLFDWQVPHILFGKEYLYTLTVKYALILTAVVVTAVMTREAWRPNSPSASSRRVRLLQLGNLLVLGVALAAAILGLLHAIVLHVRMSHGGSLIRHRGRGRGRDIARAAPSRELSSHGQWAD
ncbi:MAG: hypothetical protein ACREJR_02580 [Candidatus Rokuibacteriota bacterium]